MQGARAGGSGTGLPLGMGLMAPGRGPSARDSRPSADSAEVRGGLEQAFEQALLLALDGRRLALGRGLAERGILLQALALGDGIDLDAIGLLLAPKDEAVDDRLVALDLLGGFLVDLGTDIGIDAGGAGVLQQRHLAACLVGGGRADAGVLAVAEEGGPRLIRGRALLRAGGAGLRRPQVEVRRQG